MNMEIKIDNELLKKYKDNAKLYLGEIIGQSEYEKVTKGGEFNIYCCPNCGENQFVQYDSGKTAYVCLHCGIIEKAREVHFCSVCGEIFGPKDIAQIICDDCFVNECEEKD